MGRSIKYRLNNLKNCYYHYLSGITVTNDWPHSEKFLTYLQDLGMDPDFRTQNGIEFLIQCLPNKKGKLYKAEVDYLNNLAKWCKYNPNIIYAPI